MNYRTEWINACFSNAQPAHTICARFRGCTEWAEYSAGMLELLKSDPDTVCIYDGQTGEILYNN